MTSPPKFPIPGDGGIIGFNNGTAIFHNLPDHSLRTFSEACRFFLIANEITLAYLATSQDPDEPMGLSSEWAESI